MGETAQFSKYYNFFFILIQIFQKLNYLTKSKIFYKIYLYML